MQYNNKRVNIYKPKKHSWWITTFDASKQGKVDPGKIGFRCVADLSAVKKQSARTALINRLRKSTDKWTINGMNATFKWNFK